MLRSFGGRDWRFPHRNAQDTFKLLKLLIGLVVRVCNFWL